MNLKRFELHRIKQIVLISSLTYLIFNIGGLKMLYHYSTKDYLSMVGDFVITLITVYLFIDVIDFKKIFKKKAIK